MPLGPTPRWAGWATVLLGPALVVLCGVFAVDCTETKGRPPVARMRIEPRYVPVNQATLVDLDGRRSCDEIDYPDTCDKSVEGETGPPLTCPGGVSFRWSLDAPFTPEGGDSALEQPYLQVTVTPDRPITVTLKVTDCDQNTVTTQSQIGIILPYPDAGVPDAAP